MEKLKPCPFCEQDDHGENRVRIRRYRGDCYRVMCGNCGASGTPSYVQSWHKTKIPAQGEAVKAWNVRADTVKTARCVVATDGSVICSECGMPFVMTDARFCPMCGARLLDLIVTSEVPDGTEKVKIITEEQLRKSEESFKSGQKTIFIPPLKTAEDNGKDVTQ